VEAKVMTEVDWLAGNDLRGMLASLTGRGNERRLRLLCCACCRGRTAELAASEDAIKAVEVTEGFVEGLVTLEEYEAVCGPGEWVSRDPFAVLHSRFVDPPVRIGQWAARRSGRSELLAFMLREIFGNPFRPVALDSTWNTAIVMALGRATYEERQLPSGQLDSARLAVFADALEDAGCTRAELLAHLRSPGPHVRGCWALDAVLAKE
jgi:hypothetical protein